MKKNQLLNRNGFRMHVIVTFIALIVCLVSTSSFAQKTFRGVNWAADGNNYQTYNVAPIGIKTNLDYNTTYATATSILKQWTAQHINTIRIPINPYTVAHSWWGSYQGVINAATDLSMYVIICPWTTSASIGKVEDLNAQQAMWDQVLYVYHGNDHVKYEIFNEPHSSTPSTNGWTLDEWKSYSKDWIARYTYESWNIEKWKIIVDGYSWASWVNSMASDPAYDGCYFGYHVYDWWYNAPHDTQADWQNFMRAQVSPYESRTICTEFGVPFTQGVRYDGIWYDSDHTVDNLNDRIRYLDCVTQEFHDQPYAGAVVWNGVGTAEAAGDDYAIDHFTGNGEDIAVNNQTGLDNVYVAYGILDPRTGKEFASAITSNILTPETPTAKAISAYPNPATSMLNLSLPNISDKSVTVNIRSLAGNLVHSEKLAIVSGQQTYPVTLGKLATGSYFVNVVGSSLTKTIKIEVK